jgi:hypothetical protein
VIRNQAVAVALEGPPELQVANRAEERGVVAVVVEDRRAVVAAVDDVVDEAFGDRADGSWRRVTLA